MVDLHAQEEFVNVTVINTILKITLFTVFSGCFLALAVKYTMERQKRGKFF